MTIYVNVVQVAPNHQYVWNRDGVRRTDQWMVLSEGGDSVMSVTAGRCAIPIASLTASSSAAMTALLYTRAVSLARARVLPTDDRDYILRIFILETSPFRYPDGAFHIQVGMAIALVDPAYLERELAEDVHRILEDDLGHGLYCRSIFPMTLTHEALFVADIFLMGAEPVPEFDLMLQDLPSTPPDPIPGVPRFAFIE